MGVEAETGTAFNAEQEETKTTEELTALLKKDCIDILNSNGQLVEKKGVPLVLGIAANLFNSDVITLEEIQKRRVYKPKDNKNFSGIEIISLGGGFPENSNYLLIYAPSIDPYEFLNVAKNDSKTILDFDGRLYTSISPVFADKLRKYLVAINNVKKDLPKKPNRLN
jgi:hypothetical protein